MPIDISHCPISYESGKRRKGYKVRNGHRQYLTSIKINSINEKGAKAAAKPVAKKEAAPKAAAKKETAPKAETKKAAPKAAATKEAAPKAESKAAAKPAAKKAAAKPAAKKEDK